MNGFNLIVQYEDADDWSPAGWRVYLPHQCDTWDIAGEFAEPVPVEVAVAELERFILEAQEALAALRRGENYGDPEF